MSGGEQANDFPSARVHVSVVQSPTLSLDDDVAVTRRVLDQQDGPTTLVGHSYGGVDRPT